MLPLQLQPNHGWKYGKAVVAKREPEEPKPLLVPKSPELDYPPGLDKDIINAIGATSLITLVGFAMLQCQVPLSQTPSPRGVFARTDGGAPGGNPGEDVWLALSAVFGCALDLFSCSQCYVLARSAKQTNEHKSKPMK